MASSSKTPSGTSGLWDPNYFDEGVRIHATKALSKLRSMYNAGSPFFTRQSIREIYQQLRELRDKVKKISVTGLDGVVVDFDVRTGSTVEADDPELEFLL